jgi:hypothetical protein
VRLRRIDRGGMSTLRRVRGLLLGRTEPALGRGLVTGLLRLAGGRRVAVSGGLCGSGHRLGIRPRLLR